jgi:hypothetical protein
MMPDGPPEAAAAGALELHPARSPANLSRPRPGIRLSEDEARKEGCVNYMLLLYVEDRPAPGTPESQAAIAALGAYREELDARGALVAAGPLAPPRSATTLRERGGRLVTTDGPFAETREWLGGYFIVDCDDLDEALELAAKCPTARNGSVEVRPIMEVS